MAASIISSRTNAKVKQLRAAFAENSRLSGGLVAIEGEHLLQEAIRSGMALRTIFVSGHRAEHGESFGLPEDVEVLRLTAEVFASAVETRSPQGIAALMTPPAHRLEDALAGPSPLILIACGLQDPGNLGTLARSAEAFGAAALLTAPGTVSLWNAKALRASAGSAFRLPVVAATAGEIAGLRRQGIRLLATTGAAGDGVADARGFDLRGACAVMIGNEGAGLAREWLAMADATVTIPCPGPVESLNAAVAGSLLLYEAARQRGAAKA